MDSSEPYISVKLSSPLHLTALNTWLSGSEPFTNPQVSALFSRSVVFDRKVEKWVVRIGAQQAPFSFDDTPVFVMDVDFDGRAVLSSDWFPKLEPDTYYVLVSRDGGWYLQSDSLPARARFTKNVQQRLSALVEQRGDEYEIRFPQSKVVISHE